MEYCVKEKRVGKDQPEQWKKKAGTIADPCLFDIAENALLCLLDNLYIV
jgi:hypothetical protein